MLRFNKHLYQEVHFHEGDLSNRGMWLTSLELAKRRNLGRNSNFVFLGSYALSIGHITIISAIVKEYLNNKKNPNFIFSHDFYCKLATQETDIKNLFLTYLAEIGKKFGDKNMFLTCRISKRSEFCESQLRSFGVWNIPKSNGEIVSANTDLLIMQPGGNEIFLDIVEFASESQVNITKLPTKNKIWIGLALRTDSYYEDNSSNPEIRSIDLGTYKEVLEDFLNVQFFEFGVQREESLNISEIWSSKVSEIDIFNQIYMAINCDYIIANHTGFADILGEFGAKLIMVDYFPVNQPWHHKSEKILCKQIHGRKIRVEYGNLKYVRDIPKNVRIIDNSSEQITQALKKILKNQ